MERFNISFFDENHARTIGIKPRLMKALFLFYYLHQFAAMQTVGAFLVIALVIIPGAIGYLLCDRFQYQLLYLFWLEHLPFFRVI